MIRATVARTVWASGVTGYEVKAEGHAGAGEYGQDIVCAAVSVLLQTLANEVVEAARAEEPAEENPAAEETTVNPVEAGPAVAPKDENGKFDTTKIAEASDFTGIEEESGCKS